MCAPGPRDATPRIIFLAACKTLAKAELQSLEIRSTLQALGAAASRDSTNSKANASVQMEAAPMRMQEEPVAETPLLGSHFEPEEPEHEEEETPQSKGRSVPPPPNTFSEAEALRWPAIREALSDETRQSVGQGLAVRVVRGYAAASDTPPKVAEVLEKTVAWRREYDVDAALTKPAPAWRPTSGSGPVLCTGRMKTAV